MRRALEILGIGSTFHGFRLGDHPDRMDAWIDLVDQKYPKAGGGSADPSNKTRHPGIQAEDFDRVIGDYAAVTDMPCAAFWRELMAAYPDAKVVLMERDADAWFRSFEPTVIDGMMSSKGSIFANPWVAAYVGDRKIEMMFRVFLGYFGARDKRVLAVNAKRVYIEHNAEIRETCKAQGRDLLDYKLGSGWGPLCDFLGVDVPKGVEFPRGNEAHLLIDLTHKIQRQRVAALAMQLLRDMAIGTAVLGVVLMSWKRPQMLTAWISQVADYCKW
jgi:hypothetical protein